MAAIDDLARVVHRLAQDPEATRQLHEPAARGAGDTGRQEAAREIREMGFEQYIKMHINNDGMAFNPAFYREHRDLANALADALWSGQSTVEQFGYHEEARVTWDALAKAPEVKVPTLILCGADDDVNRRGSTPVGTARRLGELVPGAELTLVSGVRHMTFWDGDGALKALQDFLARHPIAGS